MSTGGIRILGAVKNTLTQSRLIDGRPEITLLDPGAGRYFPGEFTDLSEARAYALNELQRDPSAILYLMRGNQILDTFMDQEHQTRRQKRRGLIYVVVSAAAVFITALCVSVFVMPFTASLMHGVFAAGMVLLYLAGLAVYGARNIHAFVMVLIVLVLILFLTPAIHKLFTSASSR